MEQKSLSNATASLVLGIISIVGSCLFAGLVGLITGIIGLVISGKDKKEYAANPEAYTEQSYKLSKAGRVCSIIGLILSALAFIFVIIYVVFMGAAFSMMPWEEMQNSGY
ncbi:CCC motif membrane protein [Sanyastnella coralliicola]|uniref:CCC motif membrane protein n=1 Tax=Sanyastnella coralliicola TaxID=3069118 RepID=UPI0027B8FBCA|nr:CCC motif membrane protein [Longitalea sp. SCSIO 12813]